MQVWLNCGRTSYAILFDTKQVACIDGEGLSCAGCLIVTKVLILFGKNMSKFGIKIQARGFALVEYIFRQLPLRVLWSDIGTKCEKPLMGPS